MDRPRRTPRRKMVGHAALGVAAGFLICGISAAETRTATTSIGITVERHAAILLPADAAGFARLSTATETLERPVAIGNANPTLITVPDSRSFSPVSSARPRVAVTVFEP